MKVRHQRKTRENNIGQQKQKIIHTHAPGNEKIRLKNKISRESKSHKLIQLTTGRKNPSVKPSKRHWKEYPHLEMKDGTSTGNNKKILCQITGQVDS